MPSITALEMEKLLFEWNIDDSDRKNEHSVLSAQMLQYIFLIREFETRVLSEYWER